MRRALFTCLCTLFVACSAPTTPEPSDGGSGSDVVSVDGGGEADSDADTPLPLERGERLSDLADLDSTDDVVLRDAGEFLFVFGEGRELGWLSKEDGTLVTFLQWPDTEHPGASRASRDFAFDDERVWFTAELADGSTAIVGAEHDLGNPFPFFGQPIVIIDVGPRTTPAGVAIFENRLVAAFNEFGPTERPPSLVFASEQAGVSEEIELESLNVLERLDVGPDGLAFWTFGEPDGAMLQVYDGDAVETLTWPHLPPEAAAVHDGGYAWALGNGLVATRAPGDSEPVEIDSGVLEGEDLNAEMAASTDVVALADGSEILVWERAERTHRVDATGEVHSLIVDSSSIYWSTTQGVYRFDVAR